MPAPFSFEPARSAVLAMDCQTGILSIYVKDQEGFLKRAGSVLRRARAIGMCVFYVQVGFRPKLPEISSRNALFRAIKESPRHQKLFEGPSGAIHPALAPAGDDIVVTKHRSSAFLGTDLDMILRAKEIDTLVLFGMATSGVVLSTLLQAADADYRVAVLRNCCADLDEGVHECLVNKVFPRLATVMTASEFLAACP
jgi:nicotinamidase-related amidase